MPTIDVRKAASNVAGGAKAVWQGRLQAAHRGFPGGLGGPELFGPPGGGAP